MGKSNHGVGESSFQTLYIYTTGFLTFTSSQHRARLDHHPYVHYSSDVLFQWAKVSARIFLLSFSFPSAQLFGRGCFCTSSFRQPAVLFIHFVDLVILFCPCSVPLLFFSPSRAPCFTLLLNRYPAGCLSLFIWKWGVAIFNPSILLLPRDLASSRLSPLNRKIPIALSSFSNKRTILRWVIFTNSYRSNI